MNRFLSCALLVAASIARADVTTKLSIEPATLQAGIPASIIVTITNGAATEVKLPRFVTLRAEKADGSSFVVTERTRAARPIPGSPVTLAPHAMTTVRWDPDGGWSMPWFGDARLTVPGTYRITVRLTDEADGSKAGSASPPATLTVTAAKGDDAAVCEAARTKAGNAPADSCPVGALLLEASDAAFWSRHRSSTYASFFAYPAPMAEQIAAVEARIKAQPNDPIIDMRRLFLAKLEHLAAGEASAQKETAAAKAHAGRALALYKQVAANGRVPDARKRAALLADDLDKQMAQMHWR